MKQTIKSHWPFIVFLFPLSFFYFWGIPKVPFHPDESTQLFMSSDFEALLTNPSSLFWDPNNDNDPRQRYRELDAPITKYLLGFGRSVVGLAPLKVDWNWSKSWDENITNGAFPDPYLTRVGRATITLLLPLSMVLIYSIGKQLRCRITGFLAAFFLGTNAVVLLHCRRAMAEGTLLFGIVFTVWCIFKAYKHPWLVGLGFAFAFNAKQSALILLPAVLFALVWPTEGKTVNKSIVMKNLVQFTLVFGLFTLLLNPIYWQHTLNAGRSAVKSRTLLMNQQTVGTQTAAPEKAMNSIPKKMFILLLNLYISPPEYGLIENLVPTQDDLAFYMDIPGHNLFRGIIWGGIFFVLTLFGLYSSVRNIRFTKAQTSKNLILVLISTGFVAIGLVALLQIYWIRYTIPLVPFICIWIAYGMTTLVDLVKNS